MQTNPVVEFILWLLIAASVIAAVAARLRLPKRLHWRLAAWRLAWCTLRSCRMLRGSGPIG